MQPEIRKVIPLPRTFDFIDEIMGSGLVFDERIPERLLRFHILVSRTMHADASVSMARTLTIDCNMAHDKRGDASGSHLTSFGTFATLFFAPQIQNPLSKKSSL